MAAPFLPAQVKALAALEADHRMVGLVPGAGKTRIALEHARAIGARLTCVIAPAIATTGVWPVEAARWRPDLSVIQLRELRAGRDLPTEPVLVVTSPDLIVASERAREILLSLPIDLLVWDEAHMGKSPSTARTRLVYGELAPRCRRTIAMSGTFVLNHAGELFPHLAALAPERVASYPTYASFCRRFCTYGLRRVPGRAQPLEVITGSNVAAFPELREMLAGVLFKLPRAEVEAGLPPLRSRVIPLPAESLNAGLIDEAEQSPEAEELREALAAGEDLGHLGGHISRLRRLLAMAKIDAVAAWVEGALAEGEPALLLFGWHVEALELLHAKLSHLRAELVTGATPARQRDTAVARLQTGEICILVGQIAAIGTAVTMTAARRVVLAEMAWQPAMNLQCVKRAHRHGQIHPVLVDVLAAPGLDLAVLGVLERKLAEISALESAA